MNMDSRANPVGTFGYQPGKSGLTPPLGINKKRQFVNTQHSNKNALIFGSDLVLENSNLHGAPHDFAYLNPNSRQLQTNNKIGNPSVPPQRTQVQQQYVTSDYSYANQQEPNAQMTPSASAPNLQSQSQNLKNGNAKGSHYWSEYRRQYEEALQRKIQQDRKLLQRPAGDQKSAGPASGNTAKNMKQRFLNGTYKAHELWKHESKDEENVAYEPAIGANAMKGQHQQFLEEESPVALYPLDGKTEDFVGDPADQQVQTPIAQNQKVVQNVNFDSQAQNPSAQPEHQSAHEMLIYNQMQEIQKLKNCLKEYEQQQQQQVYQPNMDHMVVDQVTDGQVEHLQPQQHEQNQPVLNGQPPEKHQNYLQSKADQGQFFKQQQAPNAYYSAGDNYTQNHHQMANVQQQKNDDHPKLSLAQTNQKPHPIYGRRAPFGVDEPRYIQSTPTRPPLTPQTRFVKKEIDPRNLHTSHLIDNQAQNNLQQMPNEENYEAHGSLNHKDQQGNGISQTTGTYKLDPHNYSIEQIRYLQRMKRASNRMHDIYKIHQGHSASQQSEKEKYSRQLEGQVYQALGVKEGQFNLDEMQGAGNRRVPLGKDVSQLEMRNEDARRHLREMLEFQMREKEMNLANDESAAHAKQRLMRNPVTATLHDKKTLARPASSQLLQQSASQQILPPLRQPSPQQNYQPQQMPTSNLPPLQTSASAAALGLPPRMKAPQMTPSYADLHQQQMMQPSYDQVGATMNQGVQQPPSRQNFAGLHSYQGGYGGVRFAHPRSNSAGPPELNYY